jgi:hypothetical protein
MRTLLTPATLSSYRPKADGSMSLTFNTQDLDDTQKMDVISHYQQFGWLGFVDSEDATDLEIPDELPENDSKTPSERLRAVMFVYYKNKYGETSGFNAWRAKTIEEIIEKYKEKIDEFN